ncbi:MAG: DUF4184 family protein [Emticicia sp.]|uniref:DUF4184 family protein n=1 Tax=Emticicia sp. TaxID=1930953 RepID=UPI003BA6D6B6
MPFTLSHTLAIYPFRNLCSKYLSFSGLFIGSMVPDFEFFVRITLYAVWSHTFQGVFFFDLPLALMLVIIFHQCIKKILILHLPLALFQRFVDRKDENWLEFFKKYPLKVIISILIGIFTHFAWDNFTHEPDYISPIYLNVLTSDINLFSIKIKLYHLLQMLSSIIGIIGFLLAVYLTPVKNEADVVSKKDKIRYWIKIISCTLLIILVRYLIGVPNEKPFGQIIVVSISAFLISTTFVSWFYKIRHNQIPHEDS